MELSARIESLPLAEPFVIARETTEVADVVWVELEHAGRVGYGEAAPSERYDESAESAAGYVTDAAEALGDDPFALEEVLARLPAREYAARAALDAALHDLQGKLLGTPVWRLLGLPRTWPPSGGRPGGASPPRRYRWTSTNGGRSARRSRRCHSSRSSGSSTASSRS